MIWADRVGVVWALIVGALLLLNHQTDFPLGFVLVVIGVPWLLLRAVDFVFSGGIRHKHRDGPRLGVTLWDRRRQM